MSELPTITSKDYEQAENWRDEIQGDVTRNPEGATANGEALVDMVFGDAPEVLVDGEHRPRAELAIKVGETAATAVVPMESAGSDSLVDKQNDEIAIYRGNTAFDDQGK